MAKVTAPLFGFGASGQLGKSIVNASWRGRAYVRRYTIPANPRTSSQTETRTLFNFLQQFWKNAPFQLQNVYTLFAKGQPLTDRNAFTQANLGNMRGDVDLSHFIASNGAKGGLPISNLAVAPTATPGELSLTWTRPDLPGDWVLGQDSAIALLDRDPQTTTDYSSISYGNVTSPLVITGLVSGQLYYVAVWESQTKPNGSLAYGPSEMVSGTPA